jgi:hypothetical protein
MKVNLEKIELKKFMLVVLVLTFLFCLLISSYFRALNSRVISLLEYQTKIIGQVYEPEEVEPYTTPSTTTNKYQGY